MEYVSIRAGHKDMLAYRERVSVGKERLVVTYHGHPVLAMVPLEDFDRLQEMDMRERVRKELEEEGE